jgi:hypothetical protein
MRWSFLDRSGTLQEIPERPQKGRNEKPGEFIAGQSLPGADVQSAGSSSPPIPSACRQGRSFRGTPPGFCFGTTTRILTAAHSQVDSKSWIGLSAGICKEPLDRCWQQGSARHINVYERPIAATSLTHASHFRSTAHKKRAEKSRS